MNKKYYSDERNIEILISLLKQSGINKVVASPGATNVSFVGSLQNDPFFQIYSCVDERSAAYMACGLAAETREPVVLSCTGATSSRNYLSPLTDAYYRKLPVLAVTSTQDERRIGHLIAQVTDRGTKPLDACVHAEHVPTCTDATAEWDATIRINRALLALRRNGGGPVHINLATVYSRNFSVRNLPKAKLIKRITPYDDFPSIPKGRIAVLACAIDRWSEQLTDAVDRFCTKYGAVVFCGHGSNYTGRFRAFNALIGMQENYRSRIYFSNLVIQIGEMSGDYANMNKLGGHTQQVWRVCADGELRDQFCKLSCVFEMSAETFFTHYAEGCEKTAKTNAYLEECREEYRKAYDKLPDLPLSNIWIAKNTAPKLPEGSVLHLGILNSLRTWNMFDVPEGVSAYVNSGGFGIDGVMSSCVGGALAQPDRLHILVIGDLAFFYDINVMWNSGFPSNMRIILVNNGKGTEFRNYNHIAAEFGEDADKYMAAAGHFGNKSTSFVRHWAEDLGFDYYSASTKEEYINKMSYIFTPPSAVLRKRNQYYLKCSPRTRMRAMRSSS